MSLRAKIIVGLCILMLCASGAVFFQKEIRIAYHRNRMFAAQENHRLLSYPTPKLTKLTALKCILKTSVFRMSALQEGEAMFQHENALIKLGYLEKQEFTFTNKVLKGDGHCWPSFRQQITNTFDELHWWSGAFLETNRLAITATPEDLPKWEKLISDFDR